MLDPKVVAEANRLLAEGKISQRRVARELHISRGSVAAIANGRRRDYGPGDPKGPITLDDGPKVRCLGCGRMQSLPCRVCRDREALAKARRRPGAEKNDPDALNLALRPPQQARYEPVHQKKREADLNQAAGAWDEPETDDLEDIGPIWAA